MDTTFPFTEAETEGAGLLSEDLSDVAAQALKTMRSRPDLVKLSILTLQCMDMVARQEKGSPTLSPVSAVSPALTFAGDTTVVSQHTPTEYERTTYYNGITGDRDHPELVYRSDFLTTPFPKPVGRYAHIPVKSLRGVHNTPLNGVWKSVGPKIVELITARKINWSSVDPARFFTHATPGEEEKGSLGPVVIWLGVIPGSTSSDAAHEVSKRSLRFSGSMESRCCRGNGVRPSCKAGRSSPNAPCRQPPIHPPRPSFLDCSSRCSPCDSRDGGGRFPGHAHPRFHEKQRQNGDPSYKVYGVSNCHVLLKNPPHRLRAQRRCTQGTSFEFADSVDSSGASMRSRSTSVTTHSRRLLQPEKIDGLEAMENPDEEVVNEIVANRRNLNGENDAIRQLEALYGGVTRNTFDINLNRDIGYVQHAEAIKVDVEGGTRYTSDWGAFLATEAKVKDHFEGNVVDLGSKYPPEDLMAMFYPRGGGATTFKFPRGRKLRIEGCATKEDLANLTEFDSEGERWLLSSVPAGKTTNSDRSDATPAWCPLISHDVGIVSVELGIYKLGGLKTAERILRSGRLGSLRLAYEGRQSFTSLGNSTLEKHKGGSTSNHVTYLHSWLVTSLAQIKKHFPHADFYRITW
ncbi:hypothetical protein DFH94DRAFT_786723 [Russula ochroleuca]|uniref:Uncharacterized protein n=1 Tax=Russula ochroleuca TaxID=152965 RepID=A0A9P5JUJ2_9AGAM|nr:hypothetical protein DFH94DRAFT_786723 [Russula ochroleuca]